jgi:hypothetical protein
LHTLHLPILLLLGISPCEVLVLVSSFPTSPSSSKMEIVCFFYCVFELGGLRIICFGRFHTSPYFTFSPLKILNVSLYEVIYLVLIFSKSPSLLKSVSECESYCIFLSGHFLPVPSSV